MRFWQVELPIGIITWAMHCNTCNQEFIVKKTSHFLKFFGPTPIHCVFCGKTPTDREEIKE